MITASYGGGAPTHDRPGGRWQKDMAARAIRFRSKVKNDKDFGCHLPLLRWLCHLHSPYRCRTHVHRRTVVTSIVVGFGSAEPVALRFIHHVVNAPSGVVPLVLESICEH